MSDGGLWVLHVDDRYLRPRVDACLERRLRAQNLHTEALPPDHDLIVADIMLDFINETIAC